MDKRARIQSSSSAGTLGREVTPQRIEIMASKPNRDIEKNYPASQFAAKLRRLADAVESAEPFTIQIANERIHVPKSALFNIEHERSDSEEEIEFQLKWNRGDSDEASDPDEAVV